MDLEKADNSELETMPGEMGSACSIEEGDSNSLKNTFHAKNRTFITYLTMSGAGAVVPPLTTHVLDTARGVPAAAVPMTMYILNEKSQSWEEIEQVKTNSDGRGGFFTGQLACRWKSATYKLHFDTKTYFSSHSMKGFYPYVEIVFQIEDPTQHYHVPLLLSPYGYSTYRGS